MQSDKQTLKERMIQALNERQRKLEEEKNTLSLTDGASKSCILSSMLCLRAFAADIRNAVPSSRNLRSQKKGKENFTAVVNQRRKAAPSHISYTLKESEIQEDLAAIQKVSLIASTHSFCCVLTNVASVCRVPRSPEGQRYRLRPRRPSLLRQAV
jgi:hypothetical protein